MKSRAPRIALSVGLLNRNGEHNRSIYFSPWRMVSQAISMYSIYASIQGFFVTVRAGTAYRHLFFQSKENKLFVMYIINEFCDFRLVSTGTYYLVPAPIFLQKKP